jgi:hypothetical protein
VAHLYALRSTQIDVREQPEPQVAILLAGTALWERSRECDRSEGRSLIWNQRHLLTRSAWRRPRQ